MELGGSGSVLALAFVLFLWSKLSNTRRDVEELKRRVKKLELDAANREKEAGALRVKTSVQRQPKSKTNNNPQTTSRKDNSVDVVEETTSVPVRLPIDSSPSSYLEKVIVTRTTDQKGQATDTWVEERVWTSQELADLMKSYSSGASVAQMAMKFQVDSKDIAYAIARNVFNCTGELDDIDSAENNGKGWTTVQRNRVGALIRSGKSIPSIATEYGRTQLAIVWQAIDNGFRPKI
jgi:hypothetical protein